MPVDLDLDYYQASDGLSQDEFRRLLKLRQTKRDSLSREDLYFIIECLETVGESRANKIEDLEQEGLDNITIEKEDSK